MTGKATSLKAKIRNIARKQKVSAQVILQNYMFERFLERLSRSSYKNNFVLKGGILIADLVGVENRSTMDMDTTIKNLPMTEESLSKAIKEISNVEIDDNVHFTFIAIKAIRGDDEYGGFRVRLDADYQGIITKLAIDVTIGDAITPSAIVYPFKMIFEEGFIDLWAYNVETVLAEKVETILQRGELNTRPRDFYDIYILVNTQDFDMAIFSKALEQTARHRETTHVLLDTLRKVKDIESSQVLRDRWVGYSRNYPYAEEITYEDTIRVLKDLLELD